MTRGTTYEVQAVWREGGRRHDETRVVMGEPDGPSAADAFVRARFEDATERTLQRASKNDATYAVDRGGERFEVDVGWRAQG